MRLDRNINANDKGRYVIINPRRAGRRTFEGIAAAIHECRGAVDFGSEEEFFGIKFKDKCTRKAWMACLFYGGGRRFSSLRTTMIGAKTH